MPSKKPSKANLECADVILGRNHIDPKAWPMLRRDIALTIDMAEAAARAERREVDAKVCENVARRYSGGTFNDSKREVRSAEDCAAAIRKGKRNG